MYKILVYTKDKNIPPIEVSQPSLAKAYKFLRRITNERNAIIGCRVYVGDRLCLERFKNQPLATLHFRQERNY